MKKLLLTLLILLLIVQGVVLIDCFSGFQAKRRLAHIESLFEKGMSRKCQGMSRTYYFVSLSYIAEALGVYHQQFPKEQERVELLIKKMMDECFQSSNTGFALSTPATWGEENLYLSHIGIVLFHYEQITGDNSHAELLYTIVSFLEAKLKRSPTASLRSYNRSTSQWPADNSVFYSLIYKHEKLRNNEHDTAFYNQWISYMNDSASTMNGLHLSELTDNEYYSSAPRGCALSWSCAYMSDFSPEESRQLWRSYKRNMKGGLPGFAGFREYPKGTELKGDGDSGPIIFGIGGGATGLALTGSAAVKDVITYVELNNTMRVIDAVARGAVLFGNESLSEQTQEILPSAIRFKGEMLLLK